MAAVAAAHTHLIAGLRNDNTQLRSTLADLRAANAQLRATIDQLHTGNAELQTANAQLARRVQKPGCVR